jgi:hypothetical protein
MIFLLIIVNINRDFLIIKVVPLSYLLSHSISIIDRSLIYLMLTKLIQYYSIITIIIIYHLYSHVLYY